MNDDYENTSRNRLLTGSLRARGRYSLSKEIVGSADSNTVAAIEDLQRLTVSGQTNPTLNVSTNRLKRTSKVPKCSLTTHAAGLQCAVSITSSDTDEKINEKIGHRRVDQSGLVTYKRCPVSELRAALQLGIKCSIKALHPDDISRDVLLQDFNQVAVQEFPSIGTKTTPPHKFRDFTFKAYAPVAFQHFRSKFNIRLDNYLVSLCGEDWHELPNAGASGSVFYVTDDDRFIIKTVDAREANFLLSLLPGYYMNLVQNPETMLPKFFGFYCYQRLDKNIRVVVMNNLVPSNAQITERYDLKGSRYKRKASEQERKKNTPTLKDLDFMDNYPNGIILEPLVYDTIIGTLRRDLRVLRSFEIMDYSLLIAICPSHEGALTNVSRIYPKTNKLTEELESQWSLTEYDNLSTLFVHDCSRSNLCSSNEIPYDQTYLCEEEKVKLKDRSYNNSVVSPINTRHRRQNTESRISQINGGRRRKSVAECDVHCHSDRATADSIFSIPAALGSRPEKPRRDSILSVDCTMPSTAINCSSVDGKKMCMFIGIIDILQCYRLQKRLEHLLKTSLLARREISVCDPRYYSNRFFKFVSSRVFRRNSHPWTIPASFDDRVTISTGQSNTSFGVSPTVYSYGNTCSSSSRRCNSRPKPSSLASYPNDRRLSKRRNNTSSVTSGTCPNKTDCFVPLQWNDIFRNFERLNKPMLKTAGQTTTASAGSLLSDSAVESSSCFPNSSTSIKVVRERDDLSRTKQRKTRSHEGDRRLFTAPSEVMAANSGSIDYIDQVSIDKELGNLI